MAKYRKKPVVIEAERLTRKNVADVAAWVGGADYWGHDSERSRQAPKKVAVFIKTMEGEMRADEGDYVICGVQGEFYPCKPDIFEATYEPA